MVNINSRRCCDGTRHRNALSPGGQACSVAPPKERDHGEKTRVPARAGWVHCCILASCLSGAPQPAAIASSRRRNRRADLLVRRRRVSSAWKSSREGFGITGGDADSVELPATPPGQENRYSRQPLRPEPRRQGRAVCEDRQPAAGLHALIRHRRSVFCRAAAWGGELQSIEPKASPCGLHVATKYVLRNGFRTLTRCKKSFRKTTAKVAKRACRCT